MTELDLLTSIFEIYIKFPKFWCIETLFTKLSMVLKNWGAISWTSMGILRKLYNVLPSNSLITIYKSFIQPPLDYTAIIFDQPENECFCKKIESVQYNAALTITGATQGTSREKLYKELGLETLKSRRWLKKLCCFYKVKNSEIPSYLAGLTSFGQFV